MTLEDRLQNIERLTILAAKRALNVSDMALLLGVTENRIRCMASAKEIPYYKHRNRLYFDKQEIEDMLLSERQPSAADIEAQADNYLVQQVFKSPRKPAKTKRKPSKTRPNV